MIERLYSVRQLGNKNPYQEHYNKRILVYHKDKLNLLFFDRIKIAPIKLLLLPLFSNQTKEIPYIIHKIRYLKFSIFFDNKNSKKIYPIDKAYYFI